MHSRTFGATAAAVSVAVLLSACQTSAPARAVGAPSGAHPALVSAWNLVGVHVVSTPQASGHHVVFLATGTKGTIDVVSVDAQTGKIAWKAPVTPAQVPPGVTLSVLVDDVHVYYMEQQHAGFGDGMGHVVAKYAATGITDWSSDYNGNYQNSIQFCDHEHTGICASGKSDTGGFIAVINTTMGTIQAPLVTKGSAPRLLGGDVYDTGKRNPDTLMSFKAGKKVWERRASDAFGVSNVSSDGGWNFPDTNGGPLVARLGKPQANGDIGKPQDLAVTGVVAGINPKTGANLWKIEGADLSCQGTKTGNDTVTPYLCMSKGTVTYAPKTFKRSFKDVDVTLAGFDVKTGKVTWHVPLGAAESLLSSEKAQLVWLGPTEFVVPDAAGGPTAVNVSTGKTRKIEQGAGGWCSADDSYESAWKWYYEKDKSTNLRYGDSLYYPCTVGGKKLSAVAYTVPGMGATLDGRFVWAAPDGLHAVRLPAGRPGTTTPTAK